VAGIKLHDQPRVGILILNWNNYPDTSKCLESLTGLSYGNYQLILIDNGSKDGSDRELHADYPEIPFLALEKNLGFAGGNNAGLRYGQEQGIPYLLLLNNDTEIIQGDFLDRMVLEMEADPELAAVGPMVTTPVGDLERTICPYPSLDFTIWNTLGLFKPDLSRRQYVNGVAGCCVLVRAAAIQQAGLLDENFFMYAEETEWFYRMNKTGWKVLYLPIKSVLHKGASSTRKLESRSMYIERRANVVYTLVKHHQPLQAAATCLLTAGLLLLRVLSGLFGSGQESYPVGMLADLFRAFRRKWKLASNPYLKLNAPEM
jgi:GT2 family glycosyltransferase